MNRIMTLAVLMLAMPAMAFAQETLPAGANAVKRPATDGGFMHLTYERLPAGAKVVKLSVHPEKITLNTPYESAQVIVTATLADGSTLDVTRIAKVALQGKHEITISPTGLVRTGKEGSGTIAFSLEDQSATATVSTKSQPDGYAVSFVKDVQPTLSKLGCNAGTCHGSQAGKNGFKLSLRGYDPIYDHRALTDDLEGRRSNRAASDRSLMLMKPAGSVPHVGGVVWAPGDAGYELTKKWIEQGVKLDLDTTRVKGIELLPANPTIQAIGSKQQFKVIATYGEGSTRDVTAQAFVDSSNTDIATVDKAALMTSVRRGEATMMARYEGSYAASTVVVMGDRTGFEWKPQPSFNAIDDLVDAKLKRLKIQLSDICTDAEFLRRVTIDLTGLPPSADEVRAFLADSRDTKVKRNELIDKLIGSETFIDHWTNKWSDLLQVNRKFLGQPGATAMRKWIREAVGANMPYDKFSYEMLTGSGSNVEHPTASYYKILREPDAVMENTTQLFLAVRFNCNKCHDHPFERWTQDQYYQMAAYFAQVNRKEDPKYKGQKVGGTAVEGAKALVEIVEDISTGDVKHARTGAVSPPKFPYPIADMPADTLNRRQQAAKWITSAKNPYFAKSYVNRVWSYLTGVGLIEPIDDIRSGNPATNPELLDKLTEDFIASGFDTRKLIRSICQSRTYQLSITANKWNKDDETNYSHAMARRLPAEVLFDAVYKSTGATSKLPGMPAGARAAQLLDSNVELPGGFLELLGKPVRESACECERNSGMMLGPVLAFVSGPVVGDAVQDANNRIAQFTMKEKDDAKVVEEIYLSVLNRFPTDKEKVTGIAAIEGAAGDHALLLAEAKRKADAFAAYAKLLPEKQAAFEKTLLDQKPTMWETLKLLKATSKSKDAKFDLRKDGSVMVSGPVDAVETYTVTAEVKAAKPITAFRLEVLADATLPAKGPGRAENGNFVLNEFTLTHHAADKPKEKPKKVAFLRPKATFEQPGFAIANAFDANAATGWAIAGGIGNDQTALFELASLATDKGVALTFVLDQRHGTNHTIGKFRLSFTTEAKPRLATTVTPELARLLETPLGDRTPNQAEDLRNRYLAQDSEYAKLKAEAAKTPPGDARILGAQDLTWALLNNPAFLFNR
ncbi:hypothetical protein BH11PLA2_BH11PLA2_24430 [soil metagenome]